MKPVLHRTSILCLVLAAASACATNPVTGKKQISLMSEAQEIQIGQEMDGQVRREMGLYEDQELQQYVSEIGLRLAKDSQRPNLPWHFAIVDAPAVNAFALPGGYIYLTRGIMPYLGDEAELAGVLGHEIGHVTARHAAQQYTKGTAAQIGLTLGSIFFPAVRPFGQIAETGIGLLFMKYGRDDELQADRLGVQYAATSGWDPRGVPGMLTTLGRIDEATDRRGVPNWLSTHPQPADRVEKVQATLTQIAAERGTRELVTNRDAYLKRLDGLVFGDNPEEGIVRGNAFLHPQMRFALQFPDGWDVANGKAQVMAKAPGEERYMLLQLVQQPQGRNLDEIAQRGMAQAGFRQLDGGSTSINGLQAHVGTYQGQLEGLGQVVTRAAHIEHGRSIFVFAGLAPPNAYRAVDRAFAESIQSFRPLSRAEAADIRPNRVDLYVVRAGDTWQSIAQRAGERNVNATTLAIMNNRAANEQPRPGERIKIVVAG